MVWLVCWPTGVLTALSHDFALRHGPEILFLQEFLNVEAAQKTVKRARQAELPQLAQNINDLVILAPLNVTLADIPERFLLFDNMTAGRRTIIFASDECLAQLGRSTHW